LEFDIKQSFISKETKKWKIVNNEEGWRNYRRQRKELKRATKKAKE
jgi:uncharacterized protein YjiS (DUF1127 family)